MDGFCGSSPRNSSWVSLHPNDDERPGIYEGCGYELALTVISGAYFVVASVVAYRKKSAATIAARARRWLHYARALVVLALGFVYALEMGEYAVAADFNLDRGGHGDLGRGGGNLTHGSGDNGRPSPPPLRLLVAPAVSLLALVAAADPPRPALGAAALWAVSLALRHAAATKRRDAGATLALVVRAALVALLAIDAAAAAVKIYKSKRMYKIKVKRISKNKIAYTYNMVNVFSQMTFWWLNRLLIMGYKEPLELEDLGKLPDDKSASNCIKNFTVIFNKELDDMKKSNRSLSLLRCYIQYVRVNYSLGGLLKLLGDCVGLVGPLGITVIIEYAKNYGNPEKQNFEYYPSLGQFFSNGYVMAIIILISVLAQGTLSQSSTHIINVEGIKLKSALQAMIYEKCLKLGLWSSNFQQYNEGDGERRDSLSNLKHGIVENGVVTNLVSEDSYNIMKCIWIGHYVWAIPLKISVIMFLLYLKLGISAVIGAILCIFIMTPLQFLIGKAMSSNSEKCIEYTDQRIMKINEILQGVKFLKMHGWEDVYEKKVVQIRNKELKLLNKDSVYWALITFLTHASSTLITLVTFGLYSVIEKEDITAGSVFAGLALFNQLTVPLFIFPVIVPIIISAIVSTKRLKEFLMLPEIHSLVNVIKPSDAAKKAPPNFIDALHDVGTNNANILGNIQECEEEYIENICKRESNDSKGVAKKAKRNSKKMADCEKSYAVNIHDAQFAWNKNDKKSFSLSSSNEIFIPKAKITMIIGRTGSGKTSFLSALMGEMNLTKGKIEWDRDASFAYVPQIPWLSNTSIRENILFGNKPQPRKYKKILSACCLNTDLSILPDKDLTEVGEAGGALSGGQKQRISLARAMYANSSVLLLDDPLASLDQTVAQKIFEKGIKKMCLSQKRTVIMVTHNLKLLSYADQIVFISDGIANTMGTLANVEIVEPKLALEWKTFLTQCLTQEKPEKTAKERWQLVKLVNKFSSHFKQKSEDETDKKMELMYAPLRKRLSRNGGRYFTHDLLLPTDECEDDIILNSFPKRASTKSYKNRSFTKLNLKKHKIAERSTSLQVVKNKLKSVPIKRQASTPSIHNNFDSSFKHRSEVDSQKNSLQQLFRESPQKTSECKVEEVDISRQGSRIGRLFSRSLYRRRLTSASVENEHMPIKRLISTNSNVSEDYTNDEDDIFVDSKKSDAPKLEEEREYGKISKAIYLEYFKSCGILIGTFYIIFTVLWQSVRVYTDMCLSDWTSHSDSDEKKVEETKNHVSKYVIIYTVLSFLSIILSLLSNALGQCAGAFARNVLHKSLMHNILKCPISFFQITPLGRIINRFSIDIGIIDKKIATSMQRLFQFLFLCTSAILVNAIINPWFLIIALPICLFYYAVQKFYRSSARELQRLDAMTKSPIFSHYSETLCGVSCIRAYQQQENFKTALWNKIDVNTNAFLILNSSNCWLGIALDYLGALIVFVAIIISLVSVRIYPEKITPSLIGLAINYTLLVPIYLNWVVKFLSDMEMYMSAVERVLQYSKLANEDVEESKTVTSQNWLKNGEIKFKNVSLRYSNSTEVVVKNLDLNIPAGQKVAICGRTGSGKSSIVLSLLRMIDICEGSIVIDNVDIKSIDLKELRHKISVVPQEVVLFGGTVRENLDPYKRYGDGEIWNSLELAQLKSSISANPLGLDVTIREGGVGWNCGAKQLMGLTHSILQDSPIIVLDEPTAALDYQTEHQLLNGLLDVQKSKTIITVAHRLSTIMNYDRIIVIDGGRVVEDGTPKQLLSNATGPFSTMVKAAEERRSSTH